MKTKANYLNYTKSDEREKIAQIVAERNRRGNFTIISNFIIGRPDIFGKNETLAYDALCYFANELNECFPSYEKIALIMRCGRSTAIRAIKQLLIKGVITMQYRKNKSKNEMTSNYYTIHDDVRTWKHNAKRNRKLLEARDSFYKKNNKKKHDDKEFELDDYTKNFLEELTESTIYDNDQSTKFIDCSDCSDFVDDFYDQLERDEQGEEDKLTSEQIKKCINEIQKAQKQQQECKYVEECQYEEETSCPAPAAVTVEDVTVESTAAITVESTEDDFAHIKEIVKAEKQEKKQAKKSNVSTSKDSVPMKIIKEHDIKYAPIHKEKDMIDALDPVILDKAITLARANLGEGFDWYGLEQYLPIAEVMCNRHTTFNRIQAILGDKNDIRTYSDAQSLDYINFDEKTIYDDRQKFYVPCPY